MAPRFIGKTSLADLHPVPLAGQPVIEQHAKLQDLLRSRLGPNAAALFAEPVVTWGGTTGAPGSISWYTEVPGTAEPLTALSADRRAMAERQLRSLLAQIAPLLAEDDTGPFLRRAMALARPEGLMSVGGIPVLTEWGLVADAAGSEEEMSARGNAWMRSYADPASLAPAPVPPPAPTPVASPPKPQPQPTQPTSSGPTRPAWDWALVPAAIVVAALFLGVGLYAGARMVAARVAERPTTVALLNEQATREAMDRQREQNAALEREIEARKRLLSGNVCVIDPAQLPRLGPDRAAAVPPGAVVSPPGGQAFQGTLADLLTQAVVLVIAPGRANDGSASTGTGFFVAPDLIATNRHVIENADPATIVVTSRKLARTTRVQIVAETPNAEIGSPDIALLKIDGGSGIQPLAFSTTVAPLDQVIAAGFPGLLMQSDEAFTRLRNGDTAAVPELILTDGRVNAIQSAAGGMKIIPHSAAVSGGNSGGPLTDACGRVVGINTFITANREQVAHANYAQKADGIVAFLRQNGANVADLTGPCTPGAPPAAPATQPATPPVAPPAPTPAAPTPTPTPTPTPAPG